MSHSRYSMQEISTAMKKLKCKKCAITKKIMELQEYRIEELEAIIKKHNNKIEKAQK